MASEGKLNLRQARFCELYARDSQFFGNGVECYIEVYAVNKSKPNWYRSACVSASRLLTSAKVIDKINEYLEGDGLNDTFVDKQILFLITQHADFGNKMAAIREYNKLKARITEKIDHTTNGKDLPTPILGGTTNRAK